MSEFCRLGLLQSGMPSIEVLYHSGPCLVVNKPAGVLTQAPPGVDSLECRVRDYFRKQESKSVDDRIYTGVPHRLDRPVSGAMVFARHVRASRRLSAQFEKRTVEKSYWAIVSTAGNRDLPTFGTWRDHLRKIPGRSFVEVVEAEHPDAKQATLHYEIRSLHDHFALLEIRLETGRTHQIRVQAASRNLPILGDDQYGSVLKFGPDFGDDPRDRAIALHARKLAFHHPMIDEAVEVIAPVPAYWPDWTSEGSENTAK